MDPGSQQSREQLSGMFHAEMTQQTTRRDLAIGNFYPNLEAYTGIKEHTTPSACRRFLAFCPISVHDDKSLRFIAGTVLISGSFLVYLAYPVILLMLPLAESIKLAAVVAVWVLSWSAFSAGIFLAGPDGVEWLKELGSRMTRGHLGKKQNSKECSDPQNNRFTSVDSLGP